MIAALEVVSYAVLFAEDDASALIRRLRPDVVCKGGDYRGVRIPEQDAIEAIGGRFRHLRQIPGVRTTNVIERVRSALKR